MLNLSKKPVCRTDREAACIGSSEYSFRLVQLSMPDGEGETPLQNLTFWQAKNVRFCNGTKLNKRGDDCNRSKTLEAFRDTVEKTAFSLAFSLQKALF